METSVETFVETFVGDFAVELSLDAASDAAIVAQWEALRAAGLPSQADHRTMTNAPHVCLVVARALPPSVRAEALATVAPLLPTPLAVRGLLLLGEGPRVTIAHLVEPAAALAAAVERLRANAVAARAPVRHPVWTPHLTLARRVPRARLGEALAALSDVPSPRSVTADRLRWWDPEAGVIEELAGA